MIPIDLRKWQALDADPKAILEIKITGNLRQVEGAVMFFITKEVKETILFSQDFHKEQWEYCKFILL